MAKKQRRSDAPYLPPAKTKKRTGPSARMIAMKAIVARTRAWMESRDAFIEGVDRSDLEAYPVVFYPTGIAPKPPGLKRSGAGEDEDEPIELETVPAPPMPPPVPFELPKLRPRSKPPSTPIAGAVVHAKRALHCADCGEAGHNCKRCPDKIPPEEWERIDREIARGGKNITQLARRLDMNVKTLRGRIELRAKILLKRGSAAQPVARTA